MNAPPPFTAVKSSPSLGKFTTATNGLPSKWSATEIPHKGIPRLKFTVPSTGSIIQRKRGSVPSITPASSVRIECSGNALRRPSTISFSLAISARVTTSFLDLYLTSPRFCCISRQRAPASFASASATFK